MGARKRGGAAVAAVRGLWTNRLADVASLFAFIVFAFAGLAVVPASVSAQPTATPVPAQVQSEQTVSSISQAKPKAAATIPWKRVPDAQKKVLVPLEAEWPSLPGAQQRKLLGAAKHYPNLTPVEQERFQERLRSWSTLTPEQRSAARDKFQLLSNLPKEKQAEITSRWQQEKQAEKAAKESSSAAPAAK